MTALADLDGTRWKGTNLLWLDPDKPAAESAATLGVDGNTIHYSWSYKGKAQTGKYRLTDEGAEWSDSWHQSDSMPCRASDSNAVLCVVGSYPAPPGPDWGWRTILSKRATGELVLQMFNVCPWGEEQRAVRAVFVAE